MDVVTFHVSLLSFDDWIINMKALLGEKDTWDDVEKGYEKVEDEAIIFQDQRHILGNVRKE